MAKEDLRVPDHRVTNEKWRDGWDRTFKTKNRRSHGKENRNKKTEKQG